MVTAEQVAALRYLIFNAKDGTDLTKRILAFLIERSEGLTRDVCLTLVDDREGYSGEEIDAAASGLHAMQSCNCTTHMNEVFYVMGSQARFIFHYGDFDPTREGDPFSTDGQFANSGLDPSKVRNPGLLRKGMPIRYTFWLARRDYSREAELVVAKREELEQIDLAKPGLYPTLEPA